MPIITTNFQILKLYVVTFFCFYRGKLAYESNYSAGLRILNIETITNTDPKLEEVGFFDVSPEHNGVTFNGAWSAYVYFESQSIIVSR